MKRKPQTVTIETPEHIEIQFQIAGIGTRLLAYLVDRLFQLGCVLSLIFVFSAIVFAVRQTTAIVDFAEGLWHSLGQWLVALLILCYAVVTIGYFVLFEYFWAGSTPGKRSQHIRVIRKDGRTLTFFDSAVRNLLRFVDILGDVYPLGLVVMFVDIHNRRLGDLAAGTLVVLEQEAEQPELSETLDPSRASDPELRRLVGHMTAAEYQVVRKFLSRRDQLDEEYRRTVANTIVSRLSAAAGAQLPRASKPEAILEHVEILYRERTRIL
ncbi:MAG: RDD family protein [Desulfomonile tiedjei]|nr:RDD family protein [Desulfomonile tiedjei]